MNDKDKAFWLKEPDLVKVVRCKDCQHGETTFETMMMCMIHSFEVVKPVDFCSYGERRTNEADKS